MYVRGVCVRACVDSRNALYARAHTHIFTCDDDITRADATVNERRNEKRTGDGLRDTNGLARLQHERIVAAVCERGRRLKLDASRVRALWEASHGTNGSLAKWHGSVPGYVEFKSTRYACASQWQ